MRPATLEELRGLHRGDTYQFTLLENGGMSIHDGRVEYCRFTSEEQETCTGYNILSLILSKIREATGDKSWKPKGKENGMTELMPNISKAQVDHDNLKFQELLENVASLGRDREGIHDEVDKYLMDYLKVREPGKHEEIKKIIEAGWWACA